MPQLWTETFVTQYFWLLIVLFIFYYFIATNFIPTIAKTIKARQIVDIKETKTEDTDKSTNLFNIKQDLAATAILADWELNTWIKTQPQQNQQYLIFTDLTEESKIELKAQEEQELTLEEFLDNTNEN